MFDDLAPPMAVGASTEPYVPPLKQMAGHMPFKEFTQFMLKCSQISPRRICRDRALGTEENPAVLRILQRFFNWVHINFEPGLGGCLFRLLFPQDDTQRK